MTSPSAKSSRQPRTRNKPQDKAQSKQDDNADGADGDDAQSVDSNVTIPLNADQMLIEAEAYRQRKIALGGIPTRPIAEYSKEREQQRPILRLHVPTDEEWYIEYASNEKMYFAGELKAWEFFVKHIRLDWEESNELAGGTIPPPPPLLEMDPLELHTQYLSYILMKWDRWEKGHRNNWVFIFYSDFVEHIITVREQVMEMREEQGLDHDDDPSLLEQLWGVESHLSGLKRQNGESVIASFFQQAPRDPADTPKPIKPQSNGSSRKRAYEGEDPESESDLASKSARDWPPDSNASAPKRRKSVDLKDQLESGNPPEPSSKRSRRKKVGAKNGKAAMKAAHDEAEREGKEPQATPRITQKRRGRPPKQSQPNPALQTARVTASQAGPKQRGRPRGKAQVPRPKEVGTSATADKRKTGGSSRVNNETTGPRRSARIAARNHTKLP